MRKPILCRLGLHKLDRARYVVVRRRHWPSKKEYHRNYSVCERCGKLTGTIRLDRIKKARRTRDG